MSEQSHEKKQFDKNKELAVLSNYPNFIQQNTNTNYQNTDLINLSFLDSILKIDRSQIEIKNFIGGGAFGNVCEAILTSPANNNVPEKVAVKVLKHMSEKNAFLKEAQLMSNFKHQHILELKGICITNDPMFLVLELMKDGDLASYLRRCRPCGAVPSLLNLSDLIEIGIHVAKGCVHLEEKNYVHRDLAARNCLVSIDKVIKLN